MAVAEWNKLSDAQKTKFKDAYTQQKSDGAGAELAALPSSVEPEPQPETLALPAPGSGDEKVRPSVELRRGPVQLGTCTRTRTHTHTLAVLPLQRSPSE